MMNPHINQKIQIEVVRMAVVRGYQNAVIAHSKYTTRELGFVSAIACQLYVLPKQLGFAQLSDSVAAS